MPRARKQTPEMLPSLWTSPAAVVFLTDEAAADLPAATERFVGWLHRPGNDIRLAAEVATAAYFFAGLRFTVAELEPLRARIQPLMDDSILYQATIRRGVELGLAAARAETGNQHTRGNIVELGRDRFGPVPGGVEDALGTVTDLDRLRRMLVRVPLAAGWDDVLATP